MPYRSRLRAETLRVLESVAGQWGYERAGSVLTYSVGDPAIDHFLFPFRKRTPEFVIQSGFWVPGVEGFLGTPPPLPGVVPVGWAQGSLWDPEAPSVNPDLRIDARFPLDEDPTERLQRALEAFEPIRSRLTSLADVIDLFYDDRFWMYEYNASFPVQTHNEKDTYAVLLHFAGRNEEAKSALEEAIAESVEKADREHLKSVLSRIAG